MSLRKAAEMALDALIGLYETPKFAGTKDVFVDRLNRKRSARESIAALRQALAQPELQQRTSDCLLTGHCAAEGHKIYTAPPKREWVGLTDEEKDWCINGTAWVGEEKEVRVKIVEAIESKLKEKNT